MSLLLDACIIIDALRMRLPAMSLIRSQTSPLHISVIALLEVRISERGDREREALDAIIAGSVIQDVTLETAELAGDFMRRYRRSHAIDMADALIAATARQHGLRLATLNVKHFPMLPGLAAAY